MKPNETKTGILEDLKFGNLTFEQNQKAREDNVFTRNLEMFQKEPYPSVQETKDEVQELTETIKSRMQSESWLEIRNFLNQADVNIHGIIGSYVVEMGIEYKDEYFKKIYSKLSSFTLALKNFYNRPRPSQFSYYSSQGLTAFTSRSANTPSYPSGQTLQSYFICKVIAFHNPEKEKEIMEIADTIATTREVLGVNYKSDNLFSQYIVDELIQLKPVKDIYFNEKKVKAKDETPS